MFVRSLKFLIIFDYVLHIFVCMWLYNTTPGQIRPESKGNEAGGSIFPKVYNQILNVIFKMFVGGVLPFCRNAVGVFSSTSRLSF